MDINMRYWFSGKISRCHRDAPGSIPGWRTFLSKCKCEIVLQFIHCAYNKWILWLQTSLDDSILWNCGAGLIYNYITLPRDEMIKRNAWSRDNVWSWNLWKRVQGPTTRKHADKITQFVFFKHRCGCGMKAYDYRLWKPMFFWRWEGLLWRYNPYIIIRMPRWCGLAISCPNTTLYWVHNKTLAPSMLQQQRERCPIASPFAIHSYSRASKEDVCRGSSASWAKFMLLT
jgi:hypothetical protein